MLENKAQFYKSVEEEIVEKVHRSRVKGLTSGQKEYLHAINSNIIAVCTGVAGTGKTYVAVTRAVELLNDGLFNRIIIARPIVPCGEDLGFLPGNVDEKIDPYMRPVIDVLGDAIEGGLKELGELRKSNIIELCPLAYMRGRSINRAIMILDEAQNATWDQLIMFQTRIGKDSKIIISGDEDQKDKRGDAFRQCAAKWERKPHIDGVAVVRLEKKDIIRNELIEKIINKMDTYDEAFDYRMHICQR